MEKENRKSVKFLRTLYGVQQRVHIRSKVL